MPLYEYLCRECNSSFEALRPPQEADSPAACPECSRPSSQRILSLFARSVKTTGQTVAPVAGGACGCGGGACGCH
jgi:putative FmdB family regulatory protein